MEVKPSLSVALQGAFEYGEAGATISRILAEFNCDPQEVVDHLERFVWRESPRSKSRAQENLKSREIEEVPLAELVRHGLSMGCVEAIEITLGIHSVGDLLLGPPLKEVVKFVPKLGSGALEALERAIATLKSEQEGYRERSVTTPALAKGAYEDGKW